MPVIIEVTVVSLNEVREARGIKLVQILEVMSKPSFYAWSNQKTKPRSKGKIGGICKLLEITKEQFLSLTK